MVDTDNRIGYKFYFGFVFPFGIDCHKGFFYASGLWVINI